MSSDRRPSETYVAPTALVASDVALGEGTRVWHHAQIREGARIGRECIVGKNVYIGAEVSIGDRCKIENNASLFEGISLESGVFVGPHVVFANDRLPRAVNPDGTLKRATDWKMVPSLVQYGAAIGAGAIVLPGLTVGRYALVGAGAVVTSDVPAFAVAVGNPARVVGYTCRCHDRRTPRFEPDSDGEQTCQKCART